MWHVGSYFPDQGSNLCPLQWKHRVSTTGRPGKALITIGFMVTLLCALVLRCVQKPDRLADEWKKLFMSCCTAHVLVHGNWQTVVRASEGEVGSTVTSRRSGHCSAPAVGGLILWHFLKRCWRSLLLSFLIWKKVELTVMSNPATPWTLARKAPLPMGFPRQEYWNGLPFPSPGALSWSQGSNPSLLHWQVDSLPSEPPGKPGWQLIWNIF